MIKSNYLEIYKFIHSFIENIPPLDKDYTVYLEYNVGNNKISTDYLKKKILKNNIQWIINPDESNMMNKLSYISSEALQLGKDTYNLIYKLLKVILEQGR